MTPNPIEQTPLPQPIRPAKKGEPSYSFPAYRGERTPRGTFPTMNAGKKRRGEMAESRLPIGEHGKQENTREGKTPIGERTKKGA